LTAFLDDEPAAEQVKKLLAQGAAEKHKLLLIVLNWGELYYNAMRKSSQDDAEQRPERLPRCRLTLLACARTSHLALQAAVYKASHKMSYADCFAAALS